MLAFTKIVAKPETVSKALGVFILSLANSSILPLQNKKHFIMDENALP